MHKARVSSTLPGTNALPTASIPDDLKARPIPLTDNARTVLRKRYLRRGEDGKPAETEQEMFWRVAYHVALAEEALQGDVVEQARTYFNILTNLQFFPNSPTFSGAGTPLGQLAACFVLAIDDDMGRSESGIFQTLRDAALIQQTGGGNGFAFSRLRPKGALVRSSGGEATGPVGFLRVYDQAFGEIAQGGCLTPDTLVTTEKGLLRLDEIVTHSEQGWQSHDLNVATDEGQRHSPQAYNNGVAPILRVMTDSGIEIKGTPNHKLKVMTSTGAEWRRLDELQPGDALLVKLGEHRGQAQMLVAPVRSHGNQVMPTLPKTITEEFAFLIGYMASTGFIAVGENDHRIGVTVAPTSYLMDEMPALLHRIFGDRVTIHTQQRPNDASVTFVIDNPMIKDFLLMNNLGKSRSVVARVPRPIRQSTPEIVGAFLRGLFEADGSLSHGYPCLLSSSETLLREVAALLIGIGAPISLHRQWMGEGHDGTAQMWNLRLNSFRALEVWRQWIGCDVRSRFAACTTFAPDLAREMSYVLPCPEYGVAPVREAIRIPQIDRRGQNKNFNAASPKLQKALLRYTHGDRALAMRDDAHLSEANPEFAEYARPINDLWFVTVETVESAGESLTLDIEVEENHTYLANGLVTHNSRRGANMAVLKVNHPDIREFIECKSVEGQISNFNISVGITDEFMHSVENDSDFDLINPVDGKVWETVRARDLFDQIVKQAHHNGEPGVLFLDAANRANPVSHLYELESTNPCGEQFLGPFENCCLGSINLSRLHTADNKVDWKKLAELTEQTTRFLDDVVNANNYVPSVPQLAQAAHRVRRIGLGIMGLADLMYRLGVRYGSEEGQEFAGQVTEFVRYHTMLTSIDLAKERGAFPAIEGSIYDPENITWQPPKPIFPFARDWNRPTIDWAKVIKGIKKHGIRNGATMTVAPTGTIATVSGCEGYGCEPVFALAYIRHVNDKGQDLKLQYTSPLFLDALHRAGLSEAQITKIVDQVNLHGTCQNINDLPENVRHTFVVSADITAEEHIRMQAAMQAFVDNAISKCVTGDTLVLTANGLVPIAELAQADSPLVDQFESLDIDVITPAGLEKTDAFYYGGMRETRKVALSYGYQVEGTPNHRVHTLQSDGHIDFTSLENLKIGDTVVLYGGQQIFGAAGQPLPSFSVVKRTNAKTVTFPAHMSEELAYILGCITSEGHISHNSTGITNGDYQLLDNLGHLFTKLFGLSYHITKDSRKESVYTLQVNSRSLRDWLLTVINMERGARNKTIPSCILRASRTEIAAFLRGLFLDAYMTKDGRMFGIGLATKKMLQQLQVLLLNFGVVSRLNRAAPNAWAVTVAGGHLERLAAFVEFDEVWKNDRIAIRHEGRKQRLHTYAEMMPHALTESLARMQSRSTKSLRNLYGEQTQDYQRARVNLLQNHRMDRELAKSIYDHFNDTPDAYAQAFFADDHENYLYVEVKAIESGFTEVYDLSVPGSHSFIANGLGNHNTCNFPQGATVEDVKNAYLLGWKLGCKGLTVYVTGSRDKVVLETNATAKAKESTPETAIATVPAAAAMTAPQPTPERIVSMPNASSKKPRPRRLDGRTYRVGTPLGATYVTVNENGEGRGQPFELFIHTSKAGSETAAVSEAIGRLSSLILRIPSPIRPRERLKQILAQLEGIGGGRSTGFGAARVRSLPDGVAQVLAEYLDETADAPTAYEDESSNGVARAEVAAGQMALPLPKQIGDLCPECGEATLINEEGCRKCYTCGFSEC
jgi:ribonucleotide reductase alpha subunit/intein/homing endonuclease